MGRTRRTKARRYYRSSSDSSRATRGSMRVEYWPGDAMGGRRIAGQVCDGCADRLAGYLLAEQARHGVIP